MIELINKGCYLINGNELVEADGLPADALNKILLSNGLKQMSQSELDPAESRKKTIAYGILTSHNTGKNRDELKIKFDALASHDITYVGIIQNVKACGIRQFPLPYVLTNCHNSLCDVGGTINEDDHIFGMSAVKKFGGIYVPAHCAVIHSYVREAMAGAGRMIMGSDSHTRYGALGTMGVGEGGPEIAKQLLGETYDLKYPEVVCVYLTGGLRKGVGPHDAAIAIIGKVFKDGFVKNRVLEFTGPGIRNLSVDFRNGIDVMTTEMACLSSIWTTDELVHDYYKVHHRESEFKILKPGNAAYYDRAVKVDLGTIEPMIALPFHPGNAYTLGGFIQNASDIIDSVEKESKKIVRKKIENIQLRDHIEKGTFRVDQGIIAGCAGGIYENIVEAASILGRADQYRDMPVSVYPGSMPIFLAISKLGLVDRLMKSGAVVKTAFCGPCFGAGDTPANSAFSIRHTTRNFENREGSRPDEGQLSFVALMDARSIAATYLNNGFLKSAMDIDYDNSIKPYEFDDKPYLMRVFNNIGKPDPDEKLVMGPNIAEWPEMPVLPDNLFLSVASVITDPVTTTDELIPSGETSSYRSNPYRLAEFTLSRKDPEYVKRAKGAAELDKMLMEKPEELISTLKTILEALSAGLKISMDSLAEILKKTRIGSLISAVKPGDGSAREQAASCQKVLSGWANIAGEYATARYMTNLINWGILPFITTARSVELKTGDYLWFPGIREIIRNGGIEADALVVRKGTVLRSGYGLPDLSKDQREIILEGCQINYYKKKLGK
jgi:aconitate hydratase